MKVNLCRNVEKLAVTELKGVRRAALFLSTGMTYLPNGAKCVENKPPRVNVKEFDEYFKTVISRFELVLREEDIESF